MSMVLDFKNLLPACEAVVASGEEAAQEKLRPAPR